MQWHWYNLEFQVSTGVLKFYNKLCKCQGWQRTFLTEGKSPHPLLHYIILIPNLLLCRVYNLNKAAARYAVNSPSGRPYKFYELRYNYEDNEQSNRLLRVQVQDGMTDYGLGYFVNTNGTNSSYNYDENGTSLKF